MRQLHWKMYTTRKKKKKNRLHSVAFKRFLTSPPPPPWYKSRSLSKMANWFQRFPRCSSKWKPLFYAEAAEKKTLSTILQLRILRKRAMADVDEVDDSRYTKWRNRLPDTLYVKWVRMAKKKKACRYNLLCAGCKFCSSCGIQLAQWNNGLLMTWVRIVLIIFHVDH